jgi:hypothetical protein
MEILDCLILVIKNEFGNICFDYDRACKYMSYIDFLILESIIIEENNKVIEK